MNAPVNSVSQEITSEPKQFGMLNASSNTQKFERKKQNFHFFEKYIKKFVKKAETSMGRFDWSKQNEKAFFPYSAEGRITFIFEKNTKKAIDVLMS